MATAWASIEMLHKDDVAKQRQLGWCRAD